MNAQMGFVYAGVVIQGVMRSSRSVEAATTGSDIAAQLAGRGGDSNNYGQRANATNQRRQANWLTVAASVRTANVTANPA